MWIALTVNILLDLENSTGLLGLRQKLTCFADDIHGAWVVRCQQDLHQAMFAIRCLFNVLSKFHLVANFSKCKVVMRLKGSFARTWKSKNLFRKDGALFLSVPGEGASLCIPVVEKFTYLGVIARITAFRTKVCIIEWRPQRHSAFA